MSTRLPSILAPTLAAAWRQVMANIAELYRLRKTRLARMSLHIAIGKARQVQSLWFPETQRKFDLHLARQQNRRLRA